MTWPTTFANLAAGNQPLSLFDTMFTQVAQMVAIPCTAAGTNSLTLTPIGSAPTLPGYQNFSSFRYIAANNSTGLMSAQFTSLANLPMYLADGVTQASTGANIAGEEYVLVFVQALNAGSGGFFLETAAVASGATTFAPNIQVFTSGGPLTYNTPTAGGKLPLYLRVRMVGGGGGGGAITTNNGSNGTDTSFAGWTALHGIGGINGQGLGAGGLGGAGGVNSTGTQVRRIAGNPGNGSVSNSTSGTYCGGTGGASVFGGAGLGAATGTAGGNAAANSGSGGGAAGGGAGFFGSGGGAGEYVEFIITAPAATYTYTVGTGGNGGAAGVQVGGNGAAGRIEVEAFWQ